MENNPSTQVNPLSKYFRQPAIYMKLPSGGAFWPNGSLDLPVTGEIAVYPMTTRDEVTLRTPDALMNGSGVIDVIQSCCPSIKDAWKMPNIDVDAVLIAIRIASYGNTMEIETKCPHCNDSNQHGLDLQICLGGIKAPDYNQSIQAGTLKIRLKPMHYFGQNRGSSVEFEEQKMLQALERADINDEVRAAQIYNSMQRLIKINIDTLAMSTYSIELEDGTTVTDENFINEFYANSPGTIVKEIQTKLTEFNKSAGIKPQRVSCQDCTMPYEVPVLFDYASFFGSGS